MVRLEITASIKANKMLEFSQSKLSFIYEMQQIKGYSSFLEKPGEKFQISIYWVSRSSLKEFMKSEHYKFFHGAIVTLSKDNSVTIHDELSPAEK